MAIRITPKVQPAVERALPVEAPKFDKTAYQREYMRKRRAGEAKTVRVPIETDIVDAFKATGPGWQARLNDALRAVKPS